ncbi:squalene-hopene/tetraprenyl-beta-curcumene cyclase [Roseospirillum parvum]|uniref:Squalene-hopene/tetraprenyl-beta-curcumene cyclase n=2 Tax=Roseospirillum parvum TaxID=83401 RepID=A0A1G8CMH8_9PROT|nr:squalene-hopene/tetraprenyl-beta-curcumene cyclase [Roseospirillum parvum]
MPGPAPQVAPDEPFPHAEAANENARPDLARVNAAIAEVLADFGRHQRDDGHWVFELEADATIPAEYILLNHYLGTPDPEQEEKLAVYLRQLQSDDHDGWPLFHNGAFNLSASVKAYYALKLVGDDPEAAHMRRARAAILAHGGAAKSNVFTRIALALFGQVPWRAVPVMRVEVLLLPRWAPFHLEKMAYWSRTVMVPLLVLYTLRAKAANPLGVGVPELFVTPAEAERGYHVNPTGSALGSMILRLDRLARRVEPLLPAAPRDKAIRKAVAWLTERLNGEDGVGAIFPAMANTVMMFDALGYDREHPDYVIARKSIDTLLVERDGMAYCQPCVSPVWDTALTAHALMEAGLDANDPKLRKAVDWLVERQITDVAGDYTARRPGLEPGGWAFQYNNPHYPDVDDTAVVLAALDRVGLGGKVRQAVERGTRWMAGMQSDNGGWGAFDAENEHHHLNHIPFADHGALLDPPSADVSARCLAALAQLGTPREDARIQRAIAYLKAEQEDNGSWFGRWGTNYIYGTWSVLVALNAAGEDMNQPYIRRAVDWLVSRQQTDGGWGEDCASYCEEHKHRDQPSTPSQTAWALLGLMAAGEVHGEAVEKGIAFLLERERQGLKWEEEEFTAVGFPKVFYLRYHGYSAYFPLWALARYRNLRQGNSTRPIWGL